MSIQDLLNDLPIAASNPEDLGVPPPDMPPVMGAVGPPPMPETDPSALGLPPRPAMTAATPLAQPPSLSKPLTLALLASALMGGQHPAATGLLQGVQHGHEQATQEFLKNQQLQQQHAQQQAVLQEQQQRTWQSEVDKKNAALGHILTQLKSDLLKVPDQVKADAVIDQYGQTLIAMGFSPRAYDGNGLRRLGYRYYPPSVETQLYKQIDALVKNPTNKGAVESGAILDGSVQYTDPKTGLKMTPMPMRDAIKISSYPMMLAPDGRLIKQGDKPLTPNETFGQAGLVKAQFDKLVAGGADAKSPETMIKAQELAKVKPPQDPVAAELAKLRLQEERNKLNPTPAKPLDPASREYKIANDLAFGRLTFPQFRSLYSYSRDINAKTGIYTTAQDLNPNFNPAQFEMGLKFAENPKVQSQIASVRNTEASVPDLLKFSDAASRSNVPLLNSFIVRGGIAMGGKAYSNFAAARKAFADELSGALGFGSASDMKLEMGLDLTDPTLSPAAFRSAITDVVLPFLARKKSTLLGPMGVYGPMSPGEQNPALDTAKQKLGVK